MIKVSTLATELGRDRSSLLKLVKRQGITPQKRIDASACGQRVSVLDDEQADEIRRLFRPIE